jgi:undecaprenyl-phosphate 4-deoxy-4-formamido-L-arabinose transferase
VSGAFDEVDVHSISVVVPVYQGEQTLPALVAELEPLTQPTVTVDGHEFQVTEVLLVHDHGPDRSDVTIRKLARSYEFVKPIWLSRNFGQHPATLAGMASSGGDWIVTLDEDGQHDPTYIAAFLDTAMRERATLVYADPQNAAPHGVLRNATSRLTKWLFIRVLARDSEVGRFQSYRLVLGELGRSVAAYAGAGVFLDVAIGWVSPRSAQCAVQLRSEGNRTSGYSPRRLLSHFWRLVISSGTRGLRMVSALGILFAFFGVVLALVAVVSRLTGKVEVQGWTSVVVIFSLGIGATLFSLGVIAEYVGVAVNMAMGKPPYLLVADPADGPLDRDRSAVPTE